MRRKREKKNCRWSHMKPVVYATSRYEIQYEKALINCDNKTTRSSECVK